MSRGPRFLLYSNEAVGLGHLRRTIAITARLAHRPGGDVAHRYGVAESAAVRPAAARRRADAAHAYARPNGALRSRRLAVEAAEMRAACAAVSHGLRHRVRAGLRRGRPVPARPRRRAGACPRDVARQPAASSSSACATSRTTRPWCDAHGGPTSAAPSGGLRPHPRLRAARPALDAIDCLDWEDPSCRSRSYTWATSARGANGARPDDLPDDYVLATVGGGSDGFAVLATFLEALGSHRFRVPPSSSRAR